MSAFISLEWMMRIINNQVCACLDVSVVCGAAKWTGRRPLKAHIKMIERAAWRSRAKNPEKCFSKWGVPRLTVPLIKMLTPCEWSAISPVLHIFLLARRCELSPLSTRADTCLNSLGKLGHICRCVCAGECVCVARYDIFARAILHEDIFVNQGYFEHPHIFKLIHGCGMNRYRFFLWIKVYKVRLRV